jgi:hypothetical protein
MNLLRRVMPEERIHKAFIGYGIMGFTILLSWGGYRAECTSIEFYINLQPYFRLGWLLNPGLSGVSGTISPTV